MFDIPHARTANSTFANRLIETLGSVVAWAFTPTTPRADTGAKAEHYLAAARRREEARRAVDRLLR